MSSYFVDQQGNGWVPQMHLQSARAWIKVKDQRIAELEERVERLIRGYRRTARTHEKKYWKYWRNLNE